MTRIVDGQWKEEGRISLAAVKKSGQNPSNSAD